MSRKRFARAMCAAALSALCALSVVGCQSQDANEVTLADSMQEVNLSDTSGGVAATVNGVDIGENAISAYIANFRAASGLEADDAWGAWLIDYAYTVDSIRGDTLTMFENQELIRQAASELGIVVDSDEVDTAVDTECSSFDSDTEWREYLAQSAMTEQSYRAQIEVTLLSQKLYERVAEGVTATDERVLSYVQRYLTAGDVTKRSSHILFSSDDEQTAQEVLERINSGELDFDDAAQQYSADTVSAVAGGDVGWDSVSTFVTAYQGALDGLSAGETSGLVVSDYGIHIIRCTEEFTVPDEVTSLEQVPASMVDAVRQSVDALAAQEAFSSYMNDYRNASDISEQLLPEDVPYMIDLAPYEEAARLEYGEDADADVDADANGGASDAASDADAELVGGSASARQEAQ